MKNRAIKYLFAVLCTASFAACEIDNYEAPSCSFSGQIIDDGTGEPFQAKIGSTNAFVRLYEVNPDYPSPTAQDVMIMQDGTFGQKLMPTTSYSLDTYNCPHILLTEGVTMELSPDKETYVELRCIPYLRMTLWAEGDNLYYTVVRPDDEGVEYDGTLYQAQVCLGYTPTVNNSTSDSVSDTAFALAVNGKTPEKKSEVGDSPTIYTIAMSGFTILEPGESYYFRLAARINNADTDEFNYSNDV